MMNIDNQLAQIVKDWESMYRDWEEGRLPSPSDLDLVKHFDSVIPLNRDLDDLADELYDLQAEGNLPELEHVARWLLAAVA